MTITAKIFGEGEHVAIPILQPGVPNQIVREFRPEPLDLDQLADLLRRLLAEDPGGSESTSVAPADLRTPSSSA